MAGHGRGPVRRRLRRLPWLWLAVAGMAVAWPAWVGSELPAPAPSPPRSGYEFARPETQAIQDDEFANPGLFWVERGADLWDSPDGVDGQSCSSCHGAADALAGVAPTYPKIDPVSGLLINLEQRINACRTRHMGIEPYRLESDPLLSLSVYVTQQSAGQPLQVQVDGLAQPWFERGRSLYAERVGQMNVACTQCHDQRVGHLLRAERISQGQINGFPAYLLRWGTVSSVHRRFQFCNEQARAEPLPIGSDDYNALQLYVAWRGTGLAVEAPAVRR